MASLFDDWRELARSGLKSYLETLQGLQDGRRYHSDRKAAGTSDDGGDKDRRQFRLWVPLLWGTF
jgi:hypothetical protein